MTHHVKLRPYLPARKREVSCVRLTRPSALCSGGQFQGLNTMCSWSDSAFCVQLCLGMAMPPSRTIEDGPTTAKRIRRHATWRRVVSPLGQTRDFDRTPPTFPVLPD